MSEQEPHGDAVPAAAEGVLSLETDDRGLAWLTLQRGATHVTTALIQALDTHLSALEALVDQKRVRGVILAIARESPFLAGEDLGEMLEVETIADATERALQGQRVLRRLERLSAPTVAAVGGACIGAGLEIALACAYRVASDTAWFALPQVRRGYIPGWGGTVRLPRLIGLQEAIHIILAAERVDATRARDLGLVDVLLPAGDFRAGVEQFALARTEGGRVRTGARRALARRLFEDTAPGRRLIFSRAARGLIPQLPFPAEALRAALQSIAEGISLPLERAFQHEAELYGELVASEPSRALMHFLARQEAASATGGDPTAVRRAAVLGAGSRGTEWAYLLTHAQIATRLKDRKRSAISTGVELVRRRVAETHRPRVGLGGTAEENRVTGAMGFGGFGTLDLVVAAVGDRPQVSRFALREVEQHVSEGCVLASSSPLLSIAELGMELRDPSRLIGLIVSTPADHFPLVEIATGPHTAERAVRTARGLARRLGYASLRVADRPGFLVHRLLAALVAEATRLVSEGVEIAAVDGEVERFGFRAGPLARIDAMGAERVLRLLEHLSAVYGDRLAPGELLARVSERGTRLYRYRGGRREAPAPLPGTTLEHDGPPPRDSVLDRLTLGLLNEACALLADGVVTEPADVDLAAVYGLGYPESQGGPLYQADRAGLAVVADRLDRLADLHGDRFRPHPLLREMADGGASFHRRAGGSAGQVAQGMLR